MGRSYTNMFKATGKSKFDDDSNSRYSKSKTDLVVESNLGPGAFQCSLPSIGRVNCFNKAERTLNSGIGSIAPGVGAYEIPRFSSDLNSRQLARSGIKISSSLVGSGRSKDLGHDASYYQTLKNEVKSSNIGPGLYNIPSMFGQSTTYSKTMNQSVVVLLPTSYTSKATTPSQPASSNRKAQGEESDFDNDRPLQVLKREICAEIDAVRSLKDY